MIRALISRAPIFSRAMALGLNLLLAVVVARLFGASASGEFFLALTAVNLLGMIGRLGTENFAIKVLPLLLHSEAVDRAADLITLLRRRCTVGVTIAAAIAAVIGLGVWFATNSDFGLHLLVLGISIPFASLAILDSVVLRSAERVARGAFAETGLTQGITIVLALSAVALFNAGPLAVSLCYVASSAVTTLIARYWVRGAAVWPRHERVKPLPFQAVETRSMMAMMGSSVLFFALASTPLFAIGIASTAREAGVFNAAARFGNLIALIPALQTTYLIPRIARALDSDDITSASQQLKRASRQAGAASFIAAVAMIVFRVPLIKLFGQDFASASDVLIFFALGQALIAALGQVNPIMAVAGLERHSMIAVTASLVVGVPAMLVAALVGGAVAVAATYMTVSIAYAVTCNILLFKRKGVKCFLH